MEKLLHIALFLLLSTGLAAQHAELKGKVTDARGEPVSGAVVRIKDGKPGTVTDIDGLFKMNVPSRPDLTLSVSYLGYKTLNVALDGKQELNIVMEEDAQKLDEIVVVGYGTQKRSSLTGSVETVKIEDLLLMPTANVDEALAGQVAGLSVMSSTGDPSSGKETRLVIRGITGEPLLVIDGVPRFGANTTDSETRLSDLNPDDIESISVLKDAAAAAVYGARAANGVVLVTTKRGRNDKKISVNYRGQYHLQQATRLPRFLNGYGFAQLFNRAVENTPETQFKAFTAEELEMIRTHAAPDRFGDENLMDYLKSHGYSTSHSLSATGGNSSIAFYLSGGYTDTRGLYSGVGRDRYNYSMKLDATLLKGMTLSIDMLGTRSENKNTSYSTLDAAYSLSPLQVLRYADGSLASINGSNPLISIFGLGGYTKNKTNLNTVTANLKYDFAAVRGLSAYLKATFDNNSSTISTYRNPVTLYMKDVNTGETVQDPHTVYPNARITLTEADQNLDNKLLEGGINFSRTFAAKHHTTAMLIANYQETRQRGMDATNENMPGTYPQILGSGATGKINGTESFTERASMIGRLTYGFDYRYFVEANFRVDGSTKFHPGSRWGFFPSVSASWMPSNEGFFKRWRQNIISSIKFRASVGLLGDDSTVGNYSYLMRYIYSPGQGYETGGISRPGVIMSVDNLPNPDIKWAKREDYNVAADWGFWDNRFGITCEYYRRYRTNMLQTVPSYLYPPSSGAGGRMPYVNFGELKAWGWDITFNHRNAVGRVKYNVDLTLSKTADKYTDYGDESSVSPYKRRKGTASLVWWVYEADGLFQSQEEIANSGVDHDGNGNASLAPGDVKYRDQNGDHKITADDLIPVRNASYPDLAFSLKLGVSYRGFSIHAMFQGVAGYQKQLADIYSLYNNSLPRFQQYHLEDSWTEDNRDAEYPRIKFAGKNDNNLRPSTLWIKSCDFVRLKALTVGYAMPPAVVKKLRLSSLSISLQAGNVFTVSSLKDMDPESLRGYPVQRSYGAGINIGL
jgi:TonB-linked SusC/RagA family outer membrane protein